MLMRELLSWDACAHTRIAAKLVPYVKPRMLTSKQVLLPIVMVAWNFSMWQLDDDDDDHEYDDDGD